MLDLGCGAGVPSTALLARRFAVTGVEISEAQLRLARASIPTARLVREDFSTLDLPRESFDGVVALYSIAHVSRERHSDLFRRIASWLRPQGVFLASLPAGASPDWTGEWLGVEMFFSGWGAEENARLLQHAGFELLQNEIVAMREPEGEVTFQWVLAATTPCAGSGLGA